MRGRKPQWLYRFSWLVLFVSSLSWASIPTVPSNRFHHASFAVLHHSEVNRPATEACEVSRPAEALATPDPLLAPLSAESTVAVSFVIGIDGRVHSPVILESAGSAEDDLVLRALQLWRYRPALCNAVPTEMESKVEFSSR